MAAPRFRSQGLSLRWKVVIAMVGITLATAVLIFVVVYMKALGQLNQEINAKGIRLVSVLAAIDDEYWITAIHGHPKKRKEDLHELINQLGGKKDWEDAARRNPAYERALDPFGEARETELAQLIENATGSAQWRNALDTPYLRE